MRPPPPGRPPGYGQGDAYGLGQDYGRSDRRAGRSANPDRYRNEIGERQYSRFVEGYALGYGRGATSGVDFNDEKFGKETYENGRRYGREDARQDRSNNYRRHQSSYKPRFEDSFRLGYQQGYTEGSRGGHGGGGGSWDADQRDAYRRGFSDGDRDQRRGASANYRRYQDDFSPRTERSFSLGYGDGYARRRSSY